MIVLLREKLISSVHKLEKVIVKPAELAMETSLHVLYIYGLMVEQMQAKELLAVMMPKL